MSNDRFEPPLGVGSFSGVSSRVGGEVDRGLLPSCKWTRVQVRGRFTTAFAGCAPAQRGWNKAPRHPGVLRVRHLNRGDTVPIEGSLCAKGTTAPFRSIPSTDTDARHQLFRYWRQRIRQWRKRVRVRLWLWVSIPNEQRFQLCPLLFCRGTTFAVGNTNLALSTGCPLGNGPDLVSLAAAPIDPTARWVSHRVPPVQNLPGGLRPQSSPASERR